MARITLVLLTVLVNVILILSPPSYASSNPVFGPNKYTRTTGQPNNYTDTFESCNTGATYNLIVENGESGKDKISSASIKLNGSEIVKESEFNQKVEKIQKTVILQKENTLNVKLSSSPSGLIKISIYCNSGCLEVKITSPTTGTTINKSKTIIQGNLSNTYGETGVTIQSSGTDGQVSGLSQIQGTAFAGIIPLQQGQNTITVQATDACGYKATDTVTVQTDTLQEPIRLTATPSSGILNTEGILPVTFEAEASLPNPVSNYTWDLNGDGIPDQTGVTLSKVTANYQYVGLYFPKVTITDTQGNIYEETTIVNVLSKEEMDALLKGKWMSMINALNSGDTTKALSQISSNSQAAYKTMFGVLSSQLPSILVTAREFNLIKITDNVAKYKLLTSESGKTYSYEVIFIRDNDGLWKIKEF